MDLTQNQPSLDLNLLFQTPGTEEFVNVDDFFNTYVAELSHRTKRAASLQDPGLPDAKLAKLDVPTAPNPIQPQANFQAGVAHAQGYNLPPQQAYNQAGAYAAGAQNFNLAEMLQSQGLYAPPGAAVDPMQQFTAFAGFGGINGASGYTEGGGQQQKGTTTGRGKSHKQQESNKVAQQRYRERKKQKFQEMEVTIAQLQQQLAQLQALQQHNSMLEGMNTDLEKQLIVKEREVERLKQVLDTQADASLDQSGSGSMMNDGSEQHGGDGGVLGANAAAAECGVPGCGTTTNAMGEPAVLCDVLPRDLSGIDFKSGFSDQVARMNAYLDEHSLRTKDPSGQGIDKEVLLELAQIVGRSCQLCQAAIRAEGVRVLDLIVRSPDSYTGIESPDVKAKYQQALESVKLTLEQQEQLLMLRKSHLEKMRSIYQDRQALNMAAMGLMLPHTSRNPYEDNTLEGRMNNMSHGQYLPIAKSNAELAGVLDSVKDNLRQEQRAVMDLNCCLISRIMTPLQAALYMTGAYPLHCDALALANVLAQKLGREEEGVVTGGGQNNPTGGTGNNNNTTTVAGGMNPVHTVASSGSGLVDHDG